MTGQTKYPLVSVIIPCYNSQSFITYTLESVLQQTYKNIEVICINDGSTDNTESILIEFCNTHTNFQYLNKANSGVSDTRNIGLSMAKGEFILFLDSDDVLTNENIQLHMEALNANKDAAFSSAVMIKIDEQGKFENSGEWLGVTSNALEDILTYNQFTGTCPSAYMFRTHFLIEKKLLFDIELTSTADRFFLCQAAIHAFGVRNSPKPTVLYRSHSHGMSATLNEKLILDNTLFFNKVKRKLVVNAVLNRKFRYKTNYILAGAYLKLKHYGKFLKHSLKAFWISPKLFILGLFGFKKRRAQ